MQQIFNYANLIFLAVFSLECLIKIVAFGVDYFKISWNVFDFVVVVTSLITIFLENTLSI
jgi:hypothetical protein